MRKIIIPIVLFVFSFIFLGCPYTSSVPLDEKPEIAVDSKYLGKWGSSNSNYYVVTKKNNYVYSIINMELDSNGIEEVSSKYEGFLSKIGNTTYLNLKDLETAKGDKEYLIYKIEFDNESIFLTGVTPYIKEEFTESKKMKKYFEKNQNNSYFFMDAVEYKKIR